MFDESVVHNAQARVGIRPNTVLPVGVGVGGGWAQEDISNLDQRVQDRWVRGDVFAAARPFARDRRRRRLRRCQVSNRDALRDGLGDPVIGPDGRYVTDKSCAAPDRVPRPKA